jgi:transposase, IS30 family
MCRYKHLTPHDRCLIAELRAKGVKQSEIARRIGRSPATVSRELWRNGEVSTPESEFFIARMDLQLFTPEAFEAFLQTQPLAARAKAVVAYDHVDAQIAANNRALVAQHERRGKRPETRAWIIEKLRGNWSPEQIAGRSKIDGPEPVSHEYVYSLVRESKRNGGDLHRLLKRFGKRKQRLGAREYPKLPVANGKVSIDERPAIVAERARIGDCEADLIIGYKQSGCILSVVDRTSRAVCLRKLETKTMAEVLAQLEIALKQFGVVFTLTVDNGTEFNAHKVLTEKSGIRVFFTHPYCSSERGSIENLNGLVRYYLPKRTSFANLTQERLDRIAALLNDRPRECLAYLTPFEVHSKNAQLCALPSVALAS